MAWTHTRSISISWCTNQNSGNHTSKPVSPCRISTPCAVVMCAKSSTKANWTELYYSSRCYFNITSQRKNKSEGGKEDVTEKGKHRNCVFMMRNLYNRYIKHLIHTCWLSDTVLSFIFHSAYAYCLYLVSNSKCFFSVCSVLEWFYWTDWCSSALVSIFFFVGCHYLLPQITPSSH